MALTPTVTNVSVINRNKKWYTIIHKLVLVDDGNGSGFEKDYSLEHMHGVAMSVRTNEFKALMQYDIDCYKQGEQLRVSSALTTSVVNIQSGLVVT